MAGSLIKKRQIENLAIVNADIASGAAIATSKLAEGGEFIKRDGSVAHTGDQSMGNNKLTNLGAPVNPNDAVRLTDLQNSQAGINSKEAARVATTANITLTGTQIIDGVSVIAGDRVLVKNQTTASANGIYVCAVGAWSRSTDADTATELRSGSFIFVNEGTTQADTGWILSTDGTIILGTTSLLFVQFNGASGITAGAGLTKTGNQLDVGTASSSRIVVNADNIDLATVVTGASNKTKVTFDAYGRITSATDAVPSDIGAQPVNANLTNLAGISGTGIYVSTGVNSNTLRVITGTTGEISVANGDGVAGNPTISLIATGVSGGTYNTVTVDSKGRVTNGSNTSYIDSNRYVVRETPSGTMNGVNTVFGLANIPISGKEMVFLNGVLQEPGVGNDYTISGATITWVFGIPVVDDKIRVTYYY